MKLGLGALALAGCIPQPGGGYREPRYDPPQREQPPQERYERRLMEIFE